MTELTARQRAVLDRLAAGRTQKEIARDLDLSIWTVSQHVQRLMHALGAKTAAHAVDIAHRTGVFDTPAEKQAPAVRRVWDPPDAIRRRRQVLNEALKGYYRPRRGAV